MVDQDGMAAKGIAERGLYGWAQEGGCKRISGGHFSPIDEVNQRADDRVAPLP